MTDIVKRLRDLDTATCEDAADEIERLKHEQRRIIKERDRTFALMLARAEKAEAALREIAEENIGNTAALSVYIARAALENK